MRINSSGMLVQHVLGAALFLPRLLLMTAVELIAFAVCMAVGILPRSDPSKPLHPVLQAVVRTVVPPCCRLLVLSVSFWSVSVRGQPAAGTRLFVANHVSIVDGFLLTAVLGAPSFVARSEGLSAMPLYSSILRAMQLVFVDRSSASSRRDAATALVTRARSSLPFPPMVVFPEGTVSPGGEHLLPFRKGAFTAAVPCQPIVIRYPSYAFKPEHGLGAEVLSILRLMLRPATSAEVTFLPVHTPTPEECAEPAVYAEAVRAAMQQELQEVRILNTGR